MISSKPLYQEYFDENIADSPFKFGFKCHSVQPYVNSESLISVMNIIYVAYSTLLTWLVLQGFYEWLLWLLAKRIFKMKGTWWGGSKIDVDVHIDVDI